MKKILLAAAAAALILVVGKPANADPLHFACTGTTTCLSSGILITTDNMPTFQLFDNNNKYDGGNAFLAFLVPVGDPTLSWATSKGTWTGGKSFPTLGDFLGNGDNQHNYGSSQSFSASTGGYDVFILDLGKFTGPISIDITHALSAGTLIVGYDVLTTTSINKKGQTVTTTSVSTTPWSGSLDITGGQTPEPASLLLLGTGLLGLGAMARRRFAA